GLGRLLVARPRNRLPGRLGGRLGCGVPGGRPRGVFGAVLEQVVGGLVLLVPRLRGGGDSDRPRTGGTAAALAGQLVLHGQFATALAGQRDGHGRFLVGGLAREGDSMAATEVVQQPVDFRHAPGDTAPIVRHGSNAWPAPTPSTPSSGPPPAP